MKIGTKYFGEIDYEENEALCFPDGLFGFEDEKSFLLIPFAPEGEGGLYCLQSTQTPGLAFTVMDPFRLDPAYAPVLQKEELASLGAERSEDLFYYVLCAVKNPVAQSTVNLRCPIAIREETRTASQVILEDARYTMRHLLAEFNRQEEAPSC